jgi:hypothetical protein
MRASEVAAAWAGLALLHKAGSTLLKVQLQPLAFASLRRLAGLAAGPPGSGGSDSGQLEPQAVSTVLWAMASCGLRPRPRGKALLPLLDWAAGAGSMAGAAADAGQQRRSRQAPLHLFTPWQLANTMWALARTGAPVSEHPAFQHAFWAACSSLLPRMAPQELGNVAWAVGRLGLAPPADWVAAVAVRWEQVGATCVAADNVQLAAALAQWQQQQEQEQECARL